MASKIRKTLTIGHDPITGKAIRKNFCGRTKKEVQEKIDKYKIEMATGQKDCDIRTFSSWAWEWLSVYKENNIANKTYSGYELAINHLSEEFGNVPLNAITPAMLQKFFKKKSDLSQSMVDKLRITANAIFETGIDNDVCIKNPMRRITTVKGVQASEKRTYTEEQYKIVSEFAKTHPKGLGVYILLHTGLRRGELMGLKPSEDFDFDNGILHINRTITDDGIVKEGGKTKNATRAIPLEPNFASYLQTLPEMQTDGFLFHTNRKPFLTPTDWVRYRYKPFKEELNKLYPDFQDLTPHELRHTFGTLLYQHGTDLIALKKIMGHSSIEITEKVYIHATNDILKEKIKWA